MSTFNNRNTQSFEGLDLRHRGVRGGALHHDSYYSGVVSLSTSGATTAIAAAIPDGAVIDAVSAKIVSAIAGVSAANVTVNLAFTGGSTLSVGDFVAVGDGNVAADTDLINTFGYAVNNKVSGAVANMALVISGGADNTPSGGSIELLVHYKYTDAL